MRRFLPALILLALAPAACRGEDEERAPKRAEPQPRTVASAPAVGTGADRDAARRFGESYSHPTLGYSLRHPADWRRGSGGSLLLRGSRGASCLVAPAGPLPDWTSSELRVAYVLRGVNELGGRAGLAPATAGVVQGANVEGAGAVVTLRSKGRRRRTRNAVLASAGTGVAVSCTAPARRFPALDRSVFRPLIASVRVRREPKLEPVQAEIATFEGVKGASLAMSGRRVEVTLELRRRARALFVSRGAMRETVRALRGRDLSVDAFLDGKHVVRGRYEYSRRRGVVRVVR